jgi:Lar family restriction alleviation protein
MNEPFLRPCPFCGSSNIVAQGDDGYRWYHVICDNCGGCCGESGCDTRQKAIDKWNTRPTSDRGSGA